MVLSGEGADELFGGYLYFHKAPDAAEFHRECTRKTTRLHQWQGRFHVIQHVLDPLLFKWYPMSPDHRILAHRIRGIHRITVICHPIL